MTEVSDIEEVPAYLNIMVNKIARSNDLNEISVDLEAVKLLINGIL